MGCGCSKGHQPHRKYSRQKKEAWKNDNDDDIESRTSSDGVLASESPITMRVKQQFTVLSSYVLHGIRSNVDQFKPPREELSENSRRKLEDWVDEHVQYSIQSAVLAKATDDGSGFTWVPATPVDPEREQNEFDPSTFHHAKIDTLLDIALITHIYLRCTDLEEPPLQYPVAHFLLENPSRWDFEGSNATATTKQQDISSPFKKMSVVHAGEEKSDSTPLKSTNSCVQRSLTLENFRHFGKSWGRAMAIFRDELKEDGHGSTHRPHRSLTLRLTLFGAPFTSVDRSRLDAIYDTLAERLKSPTASFLSSPVVSSQRTQSHTTSTATIGPSEDECKDVEATS